MLLGFIIEKITNKRLDQYVKEALYEPLGLKNVTFNPLDNGFKADGIAATELNGNTRDGLITFDNMRTDTIQGTVHDEKAYYAMGGISGHAGLFANASDLAVLVQTVMNRGGYGNTHTKYCICFHRNKQERTKKKEQISYKNIYNNYE